MRKNKITLVTGLWDINRGDLKEGFSRSFDHYLESFRKLLEVDCNLTIFGNEQLSEFVFKQRKFESTNFITRDLDWFKQEPVYSCVQNIRKKESWLNITGEGGWLRNSPQACLEMYNPLVMSKVYLLHEAMLMDKFNSNYFFWIDAGLANTVNMGYFTHDKVLNNLAKYINDVLFVSFPYEATSDIHGFDYNEFKKYTKKDTKYVVRGGFFGCERFTIKWLMDTYRQLLEGSLSRGLMGTEETILTMIAENHAHKVNRYPIEHNGLLATFFEGLKNDNIQPAMGDKTTIYVLGFNSPPQFSVLIESMEHYNDSLLKNSRKILINNSTKDELFADYDALCKEHGFEEIHFMNNIGICGARQYVAEHFDKSDSEYMLFFEDDMTMDDGDGEGLFNRYVSNLIPKSIQIMKKEKLDYLKLNFEEFFGNNSKQWGWINLPEEKRKELYPHITAEKEKENIPPTEYEYSGVFEDLAYLVGKPHYCNWPILFNKEGNRKVFLDTKWAHPYEQTWMSFVLQEQHKGNIKSGVLLLNPIIHNRFAHYPSEERKENA